jgi:hypothetical protein
VLRVYGVLAGCALIGLVLDDGEGTEVFVYDRVYLQLTHFFLCGGHDDDDDDDDAPGWDGRY